MKIKYVLRGLNTEQ